MLCRSLLDDTSEEVGRKGRWPEALGKGSQTLQRLASRARQFEPHLVKGSSWTRRRFVVLFGASVQKGRGMKTLGRFGTCGVCCIALLVRAAFFLSLAPECWLEGCGEKTLGHWSLAPGDASKGRQSGRLNVLRWALAPRFLLGFKCGPQERAVAPSGMLYQRGRGVKR